jgi:hypothetical protein
MHSAPCYSYCAEPAAHPDKCIKGLILSIGKWRKECGALIVILSICM